MENFIGAEIPRGDDFHIHLRSGKMLQHVVAAVQEGGCRGALVMPNLIPPIDTCDKLLDYYTQIKTLDDVSEYFFLLYLKATHDPAVVSNWEIWRQSSGGSYLRGVKVYPCGVTTNSTDGISDFLSMLPTFKALERHGFSLHVHGETPGVDPLNAESDFLPKLEYVAKECPSLKIVLEHVSTKDGCDVVYRNPNVGATVTAHHLLLTDNTVPESPHWFCKPTPKKEEDRNALRDLILSKKDKVFLGSDSAPHPRKYKEQKEPPAGVYTSPILLQLYGQIFCDLGLLPRDLENFSSKNGRKFLGIPPSTDPRRIKFTERKTKQEVGELDEDLPVLFPLPKEFYLGLAFVDV